MRNAERRHPGWSSPGGGGLVPVRLAADGRPRGRIGPARTGSSEELDVRIGRTYAPERVANDSPRDPPGLGERAA